jgi:hypothetical protein
MGYSGNGWMYWGTYDATSYELEGTPIGGVTPGVRHNIVHDFTGKRLIIDTVSTVINTTSGPTGGNYAIFSLGASGFYCKAKLYRCKCTLSNNTLARDFIPAQRNSDNVIGLYDIANNVFYTNINSA